jgi:hypothetical protein
MNSVPSWADDPVITRTADPDWADPPAQAPDKYRQAAEANLASNPMQQSQTSGFGGYAQRGGMGMVPWSDELRAAATVPAEMIRQGTFNPVEAYRYGKARENLAAEKVRENTAGAGGMAVEVAGSLATAGGVLGGGSRAGAAAIPFTKAKIPAPSS